MFDRMQRSWRLLGEAWNVLRQDTELVMFPILSGVVSLLVMASFAIPAVLSIPWNEMGHGAHRSSDFQLGTVHYVLAFLYYLASYFVIVFFNSGLVACVRLRFAGHKPTVRDGLNFSLANIGRIFQWAVLAATVGAILRLIEERAGWIGRLIAGLLGLAWTLATTFVVPVLVHEKVGPVDALKRSAETFKRAWGESVVANVSLSIAFQLLFLPAVVVLIAGFAGAAGMAATHGTGAAAVMAIGTLVGVLLYGLVLAIVQSALQGIFLTACYQYATTGAVPDAFTPEHISGAWRSK